jgi:hypothetical protein
MLQILINIISLEPGRSSVQKARMNNQLGEFITNCNPNAATCLVAEYFAVRQQHLNPCSPMSRLGIRKTTVVAACIF